MDGAKRAYFEGVYASSSVEFPAEMTEDDVTAAKHFLETLNVKRVVDAQGKLEGLSNRLFVVRNVTAERDRVTPVTATEELETVLEPISTSYTHVFLKGGHVSALASATKHFVPEIVKAFEEFNAIREERAKESG